MKKDITYIMALILVILTFFNPSIYSQSWSMKLLNVDTTNFPKISSGFIVFGKKASLIHDISSNDVSIYEGKKEIQQFALRLVNNNQKLNVAILLDISGSMSGEKIRDAKNAATQFFSLLSDQDRATLVTFGSEIKIYSGFTNNFNDLSDYLQRIRLSSKTRLYDGLLETAKLFSSYDNKRNAIILITDGKDEGSLSNLNEALAEAKQKDIEIFSLGIGRNADLQTIGRISEYTGAPYIGRLQPNELREVLSNIYILLTRNYKISYVTPDSVVNVSYSSRMLSIFINHNGIKKNEQLSFAVPYYNPTSPKTWVTGAFVGVGIFLFVIVGLILFTRKKGKQEVKFSTTHSISDKNKTPDYLKYSNTSEPDNGEETEEWTEKLKRDIREEKTVIINKGKFKTEESLGYLVLRSKKLGMYVYEIKQREVIIGRGVESDIFLDDHSVSRMHTKVRIIDKKFFIDDLGSSNGTFINNEVVYHSELNDGDIITVGEHELIFKCI